ncbi:MAG: acyltransferase family protein [Flavobacteriia bacterium]
MKISGKLSHLNTVRCFAAAMVIMGHTAYLISSWGFHVNHNLWGALAGHGVDVFFALSGFLITYLLLKEKELNGKIFIKDFYMRRMFRIWPLYYFVVLTSFLISYISVNFFICEANLNSYLFTFLMLPTISKAFYLNSFSMSTLWSIGVEELFYLIFPFIFDKISRTRLSTLIAIILFYVIGKVLLIYGIVKLSHINSTPWLNLLSMLRFECLFCGVICAIIVNRRQDIVQYINSSFISKVIFTIFILFLSVSILDVNIYIHPGIGPILKTVINPFVISFLTGLILIIITQHPIISNINENSFLFFLGQISYGTYIYHTFIITLMFSIFPKSSNGIFIFCIIYISTLLIAWFSYRFFENPILKKSDKFRHLSTKSDFDQ